MNIFAECDLFIAANIKKYGNCGRGTASYLSSTTYEEFIALMAGKVMKTITSEIQAAKYFSFSVDSTSDISPTDQLTFTVRYIQSNGEPVERFLKFVPISSHTGLHIHGALF